MQIILYYKFIKVDDPGSEVLWQHELCEQLGLKGRVLISKHGINGTLGGSKADIKAYIEHMNEHSLFNGITYKFSTGPNDTFPRLNIRERNEIVAFNAAEEIEVDENGVVNGGQHLKPQEVHKLLEERGDEVVFFDGRNEFEAAIGKFKNAVVPKVKHSWDFKNELAKKKYQKLKKRPVVTYCTGGIRCEVISALMKNQGFEEVYQIDGGIVKYGEEFKDQGEWEGKLFVFDKRMSVGFSDEARDIGSCYHCQGNTSNYVNCANKACNKLILSCERCQAKTTTCSAKCTKLLQLI